MARQRNQGLEHRYALGVVRDGEWIWGDNFSEHDEERTFDLEDELYGFKSQSLSLLWYTNTESHWLW